MNLKGRDFLKLLDYSGEEITYLIDLAAELKAKKRPGRRTGSARARAWRSYLKRPLPARAALSRWRRMIWVCTPCISTRPARR